MNQKPLTSRYKVHRQVLNNQMAIATLIQWFVLIKHVNRKTIAAAIEKTSPVQPQLLLKVL
jgi:hypothetical protein